MTIYWAPFLHIYQPPWQDVEILKKINRECYFPLFSMLERHKNAKITLNIQGCLIEMMEEVGLNETLIILKRLVKTGKIEVVGTAKFHPILPLIPEPEIERQVKINEAVHERFFEGNWKKNGFFPPEMAVDPELNIIIKKLGYSWMIMGGISNDGPWPTNYINQSKSGLLTYFRDDILSNEISFNKINAEGFMKKLSTMFGKPYGQKHYVITAQDGETFGHHIPLYETSFLGQVFSLLEDREDIEIEFISDLPKIFPIEKKAENRAASWSTDGKDLASNVPFGLWKHPFNPIHKVQFRMLQNLYKLMDLLEIHREKNGKNKAFQNYYQTSRYFYDRALHSCWLWWACMRPHWSPNLIYKGVDLVLKTALNAQLALINLNVGEGDEFYQIVMDNQEKLMTKMIDQEISLRKVRTF
jgi:Glycosyl hydrolase family 57